MNNVHGKELDRYYSPADVWAIAFGCMVGWGAFVMPGTTFLPVAGPAGTLISMAFSVAVILIICGNYSYLMIRSPGTGGVYSYTKQAFGRDHAFLCSWFVVLSYLTIVFLNGTALFIVLRTVLGGKLQSGARYTIAGTDIYLREAAVSSCALLLIGILFIVAKPLLQKLHTALSIVLLAGAVLTAVICLPHVPSSAVFSDFGTMGFSRPYAVFTIVALAPWAFVGFDIVSLETAHFRFPVQRTRWLIPLAVLLAGAVYAAMTAVSVVSVPDGYSSWQEYIGALPDLRGVKSVPTFHTAYAVMGDAGLIVVGVSALAAILTGMIGAYRAATRMLSTMAEDRILSERFSRTSVSIVFIMVISILISFLGNNALNWFVELTSFGAVTGFGYTSAAALKKARKEGARGVQISGVLGAAIAALFILTQLIPSLTGLEAMGAPAFLLLSLWCLLGFLFYWRTLKTSEDRTFPGISISGIVLFSLLMYSAFIWFVKQLLQLDSIGQIQTHIFRWGILMMAIVFTGLVVMLYIQDQVRRKHAVLERDRIQAMERSRAKTRFLFNMSHDIRTPMNAIIGYTKLARRQTDLQAVQDYLEKIDRSSTQMLLLVDDILEMSRVESGMLRLENAQVDLRRLLRETGELFEQQMQDKGLGFTVDTARLQHPHVLCDRKALGRILLNVISNSYKFTPPGGTVEVSLREETGEGPAQSGQAPAEGSTLSGQGGRKEASESVGGAAASYELRIRDSGIGMSPDFAEKMFTAFERERTSTDTGLQGTGLGLAIVRSMVDLMGGTVDVRTAPGEGTEFIIHLQLETLPAPADETDDTPADALSETGRADPAPDDAPAETGPEDAVEETAAAKDGPVRGIKEEKPGAGRRILLAEDNPINREIAEMILKEAGWDVETAENGRIAVERVAQAEADHFACVLMDLQMPEMDGCEATRRIRAMEDPGRAGVPVIALTANVFEEDRHRAKAAGMQAYLTKPIDIEEMMRMLSEVTGGLAAEEDEGSEERGGAPGGE